MTNRPDEHRRYCGSKYPHAPHEWRQIGRPTGPVFACGGKKTAHEKLADQAADALRKAGFRG